MLRNNITLHFFFPLSPLSAFFGAIGSLAPPEFIISICYSVNCGYLKLVKKIEDPIP
jgi:hypothetical protein